MIQVVIPGRTTLNLEVLLLDYNGTLALDGIMFNSVKESLIQLAHFLEIHIITADTFGSVAQQCAGLPVQLKLLETADHTQEKADYSLQFSPREVVAMGNGANDQLMLAHSTLGIAVLGLEGTSLPTLQGADLVVNSIEDGLGLLLNPQRLKATLRR